MNKLFASKSPYLRQHAHNPVDWFPWGDEALQKAKQEDKWIFLSIGYSSCHWCHVMERESFEDPDVAAYLNEHFVSVKVDREERPDIDAIYMEAVQLMSGHGGWPLSVWLTPDLVPIYGGTYFPPVDMHQRPGFLTVMRRLLEIRAEDPAMVQDRVEKMREAINRDLYDNLPAAPVDRGVIEKAISHYAARFDAEYGGFSGAPKFPQAMGLRFLLDSDSYDAHKMALSSLTLMLRGGIWDALGGGIHRYSTDYKWLVPHFEKMLYDQATLLETLAVAQSKHPDVLFESAIEDMIAFLDRDMKHPRGGYISAIDADTNGVEGLTYVWSDEELNQVLTPAELRLTKAYFGLKSGGNWEGNHILVRETTIGELSERIGSDIDALKAQLGELRRKLHSHRQTRPQPAIDDKVITSWNALLMSAMVETHLRIGSAIALERSLEIGELLKSAIHPDGIYRICYDGAWEQNGFLDDLAFTAQAYLKLYAATAATKWLDIGISLVDQICEDYFDHDMDAFWYAAADSQVVLGRTRDVFDNAQPSATSGAIGALQLAYQYTGKRLYDLLANRALQRLSSVMGEHGTAFGSSLQFAQHTVKGQFELVIIGPDPDPFIDVWRHTDCGNIAILISRDSSGGGPLLEGRPFDPTSTSAWLCRDGACELPVYDAESLRLSLKKITAGA